MPNWWNDERDWRETRRAEQIRRGDDVNDDTGRADVTQGEGRSFGPREAWGDRSRDRVFGERERGDGYGREAGRREYGSTRGDYRSEAGYGQGRGGRFYGDDGRERIWREQYGQGGRYYGAVPPGYDAGQGRRPAPDDHWEFGFGFDDPYSRAASGGTGGHDYERGYGQGYQPEGRFERVMRRAGEEVRQFFGGDDRESHRGRGPSGYKRSDERISEEIHERLTEDPWVDASAITITVSGGEVTLSGTVPEREAKHRAERLVEDLSGVSHVQNNLRVDRGSFLTRPGRGFGDSASEAQMKDEPKGKA